jgi:two-component system, OmpR family, sensor histidine kinase CreC
LRRLSLTSRLFLFCGVLLLLTGWFVLHTVLAEVKPAVRQATEETLVDTANLLAEIVGKDLRDGQLSQGDWPRILSAYGQRHPDASIWGIRKTGPVPRVYITNRDGIVLIDSTGKDVGKDFSRWNDVYLTLRGRYGVRSTEEIPGDELSTIMHVAAPVRDGQNIIGVVTVAKSNRAVQPFIERARQRLLVFGAVLTAAGLLVGAGLSWWLSRTIRRLTTYADRVSAGERAQVPSLPGRELEQLAQALDSMRTQLEGKAYVERYVQTLTHELKSPLAAIQGAAELLRRDMTGEQRDRFLDHIDVETVRLQSMSERLLNLAQVEQRRGLEERVSFGLHAMVAEILLACAPRLEAAGIHTLNVVPESLNVEGERFLLRQAIANLIDNAVDFTRPGGTVLVEAAVVASQVVITVINEGEAIPDFALPRLTERFYSLPRPATGRKSTGLGLNFVQEVAQLHGGTFVIGNDAAGVRAELRLPDSSHTIPT